MGALIECHTCGKPVSSTAAFCPHCGERWPESLKERFRFSLIGLTVVLGGALLAAIVTAVVIAIGTA